MKTQFTKGEWYAKDGNVISVETGNTLAIIPYYDRNKKEMEANAKVMGASKEMLEILSFIDDALTGGFNIERGSSLHMNIINVISKATD